MKNNKNCRSFLPNLKDYVKNNEEYQIDSIKEYDKEMYENLLHTDIESLKLPNLAILESIAIGLIITAFILLTLSLLCYFNIIDIKNIVESMKHCVI